MFKSPQIEAEEDVLVLTEANFDSAIQQYGEAGLLVEFYAPCESFILACRAAPLNEHSRSRCEQATEYVITSLHHHHHLITTITIAIVIVATIVIVTAIVVARTGGDGITGIGDTSHRPP